MSCEKLIYLICISICFTLGCLPSLLLYPCPTASLPQLPPMGQALQLGMRCACCPYSAAATVMRNLPQSLIVNEVTTSGRDNGPPSNSPVQIKLPLPALKRGSLSKGLHSAACPLTNAAAMKHAGRVRRRGSGG